jgi:phosphinothricin acetyltransferase
MCDKFDDLIASYEVKELGKDMADIAMTDANWDDLTSIVNIYNSTIPGRMVTADLETVTVESKRKWFEDHSPDLRPIWVMKQDGQVIGWLSFQSFYGRPAYNATAEVSIYVAATHQGQGLGGILLQKAIEACPGLQIDTLLGFIFAHNQPSLKLLSKFGFAEWGFLPKVAKLDDIERDLVIVGRRI